MCGIFGVARADQTAHPELASQAFAVLGHLAQERGTDAAGIALVDDIAGPLSSPRGVTTRRYARLRGCRIIKNVKPFAQLWDPGYLPALDRARVLIGHARLATQGSSGRLANASPLATGALVGTHSGDLDTTDLLTPDIWRRLVGQTDTEVLYLALDRARRDRRKMVAVLEAVTGRAALAWVDRGRPHRVYLARTALNPLAIADDAEGNLYWASGTQWLGRLEELSEGRLGLRRVTMVDEGSLLTVTLGDEPRITDARRFTPWVREQDRRRSEWVTWRGCSDDDIAADQARACHQLRAGWELDQLGDWGNAPRRRGRRRLTIEDPDRLGAIDGDALLDDPDEESA
jgi:glucosamine--fructose-6-phosphate aminotransferase (isomerizing)